MRQKRPGDEPREYQGNPDWFSDLLEYSDRPVSKKLLVGVGLLVSVTFLVFGLTLLLWKPVV
ncbi:MAG: hypothetical protein H7Y22_14280 [Gemmatimonadaceae bacterium]|nr:hypothetical protein [Gloeobacterales cyanobacterium ES-bin-141]